MNSPLSFAVIGMAALLTLSFTVTEPMPAKADMSPNGAHLLALASIGVTARMCKISLSPDVQAKLDVALADYATRQEDFTQDQYDAEVRRIANEMAGHKNQVCASIRHSGVEQLYQTVLDVG